MSEYSTLFAPADEPLGMDVVGAIWDNLQNLNTSDRRRAQLRRNLILRSDHAALIEERCSIHFSQAEMVKQLQKFVSTTLNPAADIVNSVCVVWRAGAARSVKSSDQEIDALHKLVLESGIDAQADAWNSSAYFEGPMQVIPWIRKGKLRLEGIPAHLYEPVFDPEDPAGDPVAIGIELAPASDPNASGAVLEVIDSQSRRFFSAHAKDQKGKSLDSKESASSVTYVLTELEHMRVDHNLGRYPGATLRFDAPEIGNWHCYRKHTRLEDGTLDVGRIGATMQFIRRTQNKYLGVFMGNAEAFANGQNTADEKPIVARTGIEDSATTITSLPYDTDPANFMKEIRFLTESMAESTGVPVNVQTLSGSDNKSDLEYDHQALTEVRNSQIWWARNFEHDLWSKAVAIARSFKHALSTKLPGEKSMETFEAHFPRLSRKFADPMAESKYKDWLMTKGAINVLDILKTDHPTLTKSQLFDLFKENQRVNSDFYMEVAKHNGQPDVRNANAETAAQANGRKGPEERDKEEDQ